MSDLHDLAEAALAERRRDYGDDRWFTDHYVDINEDYEPAALAFIKAATPQVVVRLMEELVILKASQAIADEAAGMDLADAMCFAASYRVAPDGAPILQECGQCPACKARS